jgi:glycosyltransferase involved in cell wall biosynthesis
VALANRERFVYRGIGDAHSYAHSGLRRKRVALYLRRAEAVVALWSTGADRLAERFGVPTERITVIPTGVPASRFPPVDASRRQAARDRLGVPLDVPIVLLLGSLTPEKGAQFAIEAMASVPDAMLLVAGDGDLRTELERLASEAAPGRVHFLGTVAEPSDVLAASNVLVLPSLVEGLPAVLVEAGLSALPVVASDIGAVREVVIDGETGFIVPPRDPSALASAMQSALGDAAEFGTRARAHCLRRFEIGVVAERWSELFDSLRPAG